MKLGFSFIVFCVPLWPLAQVTGPHPAAHAHNDYEHARPLKEALQNGFVSVEADVFLRGGKLLVSHHNPGKHAKTLEALYLNPLDSLLNASDNHVFIGYTGPFYLMIDCKTEAEATYAAIRQSLKNYPALLCFSDKCPVRIFLSGNRPIRTLAGEGYSGIALDGRPEDLGRGYTEMTMPVISDHYSNWSGWNGSSEPSDKDLRRIKELAQRVHAEGKRLRLWAIPDNEKAWGILLEAGVDIISTDRIMQLNQFLSKKGM